jgi:hypothetical protein
LSQEAYRQRVRQFAEDLDRQADEVEQLEKEQDWSGAETGREKSEQR